MKVFAIGDLHLPGHEDKPMNVFGAQWERHFELIQAAWRKRVAPEDIVLIPGDVSWAMYLEDALEDLHSIATLPGRKILIRGNHDYWWSSIGKVRAALAEGMMALQNDAVQCDGLVFCGSRGWSIPTEFAPLSVADEKIYLRELCRLQMSLAHGRRMAKDAPVIAMMHFPPMLADEEETAFSRLLEEAGVSHVVYGHLHGTGIRNGFQGIHNGVHYHLTSCDALAFEPAEIVGRK